jgi:hypothetical protein
MTRWPMPLASPGSARELFVAAARGRAPTAQVPAARSGTAPGAFAAPAPSALPRDFASLAGLQAELEHLLRTLTRAVADGAVIVVIHAALDPERLVPAELSRRRGQMPWGDQWSN